MPWVTGSMGMPAFAYSSRREIASDQKCGGVHVKMIMNNTNDCTSME
jgi:hypothetical protein